MSELCIKLNQLLPLDATRNVLHRQCILCKSIYTDIVPTVVVGFMIHAICPSCQRGETICHKN